jgi:hypothetical protein
MKCSIGNYVMKIAMWEGVVRNSTIVMLLRVRRRTNCRLLYRARDDSKVDYV